MVLGSAKHVCRRRDAWTVNVDQYLSAPMVNSAVLKGLSAVVKFVPMDSGSDRNGNAVLVRSALMATVWSPCRSVETRILDALRAFWAVVKCV